MDLSDRYLQNISFKHKRINFLLSISRNVLQFNHILRYKASVKIYYKIDITSFIISDYHGLNIDITNNRNSRKYTNYWTSICNKIPRDIINSRNISQHRSRKSIANLLVIGGKTQNTSTKNQKKGKNIVFLRTNLI